MGGGLTGCWRCIWRSPCWFRWSSCWRKAAGSRRRLRGLGQFQRQYFSNPALSGAIGNSVWVSALATLIVIVLAFGYAYALTRSCIPFKGFFRLVAMAAAAGSIAAIGHCPDLSVRQSGRA
jgi:ABC-type Fe3+ transport system permease subunit